MLLATLPLALPAFPQVFAEHAGAVAGASIGSAAGKSVSESVRKIFSSTEEATAHAAGDKSEAKKPAPEKASTPAPQTPGAAAPFMPVGSSGGGSRSGARVTAPMPPAPAVASRASAPPAKEPTLQEFLSVHKGSNEGEVLATLGQPSSKITIPDEGHLTEILHYSSHGQPLGAVRVDNGQVVSVDPARSVAQ